MRRNVNGDKGEREWSEMVLGKKVLYRENRKCNDYKESIDLYLVVSEGEIRGVVIESWGGGFYFR